MTLRNLISPGWPHPAWAVLVAWVLGNWNCGSTLHAGVEAEQLRDSLARLRAVAAEGVGNVPATAAWQTVSEADAAQLPEIFGAMNGAGPIAVNYLRAAVDAIVEREHRAGRKISQDMLKALFDDTKQAPLARRTAYEILQTEAPEVARSLMESSYNDASLEMRHDAVAVLLTRAEELLKEEKKDDAKVAFLKAFQSARDLEQVQQAAKQLTELGEQPSLPKHFGFLMQWHLIAPFDNTNTTGFDKAYPPEERVDLAASYAGKEGQVSWTSYTTSDELGNVDLNEALGKSKGAIAYAYAEFGSDKEQLVEFRLGCINGNKLWVNGELVLSNHVYHAGMEVDQYSAPVKLRKGKNTVLLKIAQNEQTESWAQDWKFQLRVCDALGTAVSSTATASAP